MIGNGFLAVGDPLRIACDEAGHTGPDLLQPAQRNFAYASVAITDEEARHLIARARKDYPVQMPELKSAKLFCSTAGRALLAQLFEAIDGRFALTVHDKLVALGAHVFEYIYEPVFKDDPALLYEKDFHRFVAMLCYVWFTAREHDAERAIRQFQAYLRMLDESAAPSLFSEIRKPLADGWEGDPFELILRFARGYRQRIIEDNARLRVGLPDDGKWLLDLAATSLNSHLYHWGQRNRPIAVLCDHSKPLHAMAKRLSGDPGNSRARMMGYRGPLGFRLAEPIAFGDSREHPAIQLADLVAGTGVKLISSEVPPGFEPTVERLERHFLGSMRPDIMRIDLAQRIPAVAVRAESRADPHKSLAEIYRQAEITWARGDFPRIDLFKSAGPR